MLFIGIDVGHDYIKIKKCFENQEKKLEFEFIKFKNSPYIPFTFYYDFYQGGIIVHQNTTNLKEENLILSLSSFLEKGINKTQKLHSAAAMQPSEELDYCRIKMKDSDIKMSSDQILTDYFTYVKKNLLSCSEGQEIYAEITTNLNVSTDKIAKLLKCIKASGFQYVDSIEPTLPSLLSALQSPNFCFEKDCQYLVVDVGRSQSRFNLIQYDELEYTELDCFYIDVGMNIILEDIRSLFLEQIHEVSLDVTKEDYGKISEIAEEALFFILEYYGKAKSRVLEYKSYELCLDETSFSEIIIRNFLVEFRQALLKTPQKTKTGRIKAIIPVGGGFRIPELGKFLEITFSSTIIKPETPELLMASGLSTFSLMNYSTHDLKEFNFYRPRDDVSSLPFDVGISTSNDLLDFNIMHVLVEKNTPLPMKVPVQFSYKVKNSEVIKIYLIEGDQIVANQNSLVGKLTVPVKHKLDSLFREVKIQLQIKERFVVDIKVKVDDKISEINYRKTKYSTDKPLTESLENDVKRQTVRAKLAILIKKIQGKYNEVKNLMMKKKMEHIYFKACDFEIYARQKNFDIDILKSKMDELESLK